MLRKSLPIIFFISAFSSIFEFMFAAIFPREVGEIIARGPNSPFDGVVDFSLSSSEDIDFFDQFTGESIVSNGYGVEWRFWGQAKLLEVEESLDLEIVELSELFSVVVSFFSVSKSTLINLN